MLYSSEVWSQKCRQLFITNFNFIAEVLKADKPLFLLTANDVVSAQNSYTNTPSLSQLFTITDVTIIKIEIVFLTENQIESKSYFSCIPSNDLSIEALDRL